MLSAASDYKLVDNVTAQAGPITGDILPVREMRGDGSGLRLSMEDIAYIEEAAGVASMIANDGDSGGVYPLVRSLDPAQLSRNAAKLAASHRWPFLDAAGLESGAHFTNIGTTFTAPFWQGYFDYRSFFGSGCALSPDDVVAPSFGDTLSSGAVRQIFSLIKSEGLAFRMCKRGEIRLSTSFKSDAIGYEYHDLSTGRVTWEPLGSFDGTATHDLTYLPQGFWQPTTPDGSTVVAGSGIYTPLPNVRMKSCSSFWSPFIEASQSAVADWRCFPFYSYEFLRGYLSNNIQISIDGSKYFSAHQHSYYPTPKLNDQTSESIATVSAMTLVFDRLGDGFGTWDGEELCFFCSMRGVRSASSPGMGDFTTGVYRVRIDPAWWSESEDGWRLTVPASVYSAEALRGFFSSAGLVARGYNSYTYSGSLIEQEMECVYINCYGIGVIYRPKYELDSTGWSG